MACDELVTIVDEVFDIIDDQNRATFKLFFVVLVFGFDVIENNSLSYFLWFVMIVWVDVILPWALTWTYPASTGCHGPAVLFLWIIVIYTVEMTRTMLHRAFLTLSYVVRSHEFCVDSPLFVLSELSTLINFFLPCKNSFYVAVYSCIVVNKRLRKLLSFERCIFNDLSRLENFTSVVHSHGWGKSLWVHKVSQVIEVCDAILPICNL